MIIKVIQKKAASRNKLKEVEYEVKNIHTVKDLLFEITAQEYDKFYEKKQECVLDQQTIKEQSMTNKIVFASKYNDKKEAITIVYDRTLQDYQDGLFRLFVDGIEYDSLEKELELKEGSEVVFIRFVMLAGRLW